MTDRLIDQYLPSAVPGYPCVAAPRFNTTIQVAAGGGERANQNWESPLHRFVLPEAAGRTWSVIEGLKRHFMVMRGPFRTFPWRDPFDFASIDLRHPNEATAAILARISALDMPLGTGDGATTTFQLAKRYVVGAESFSRSLYLPVLSSILIADNAVAVAGADYAVSRPGGVVTFDTAPAAGHALTWGGLFDVEVRFEADDSYEGIVRAIEAGGFADITLIEVRPC